MALSIPLPALLKYAGYNPFPACKNSTPPKPQANNAYTKTTNPTFNRSNLYHFCFLDMSASNVCHIQKNVPTTNSSIHPQNIAKTIAEGVKIRLTKNSQKTVSP